MTIDSWRVPIFLVAFALFWAFVSFIIAAMGGWRALAQHYAADAGFGGKRFRFRSGRLMNSMGYGSCLTLGSSPRGLYLAVLPLFRFGHPPLLVPWSDVRARETRGWLSTAVELEFTKIPACSLRISRRLGRALIAASGGRASLQADDQ